MYIVLQAAEYEAVTAGTPELVQRNNHILVGFDAAADESIVCKGRIPLDYNSGSNVSGKLTCAAASATTGTVRWKLEFERILEGGQDLDADSFTTGVEANATADGTNGETFSASFTLSNSNLDSVAAGDLFRVKITRVGTDGTNDTMTGDAQAVDLVLSQ